MEDTEAEVLALQQARRESAEKLQSLLQQLEAAELEFACLTEKLNSLRAGRPNNP